MPAPDKDRPDWISGAASGQRIDLDRLVWDPEYRFEIKRLLKHREIASEVGQRRQPIAAEE